MEKIDSYGMSSGIVKIIPPPEWKEKLPAYDELVKPIRVREPIKQDIMGSNGTYRQVNILHQRSYNLPQWRQLCDQSEHQPPARRGERRANADKPRPPPRPRPAAASSSSTPSAPRRRGGRTTRSKAKKAKGSAAEQDRPMTPVSPKLGEEVLESVEKDPEAEADVDENTKQGPEKDKDQDPGADIDPDELPRTVGRMGGSRQARPQTQSTSARRKYSRREASARIDEEAFKDWSYDMDISDYTPERCEELERIYWKTLTYAPPLYGADMLGTLFSEDTDTWNLNKLPNLLDVLGSRVPGVNTAYLYLGMWKATFAWHLEDVDLYSINYLHFGAPKQWYSISQRDARRFEAVMKSIWPTDAKACDQFLRHKAFLISPNHLLSHFNIKVNKCLSYPGEFVVTYPYGYHSGYNLGYNCAEAVNFALDSWLPMGKIAKKCECAQAQDSVWVDVYEIERKLRGESTEYEETEDEEEEEEEDDDDDEPGGSTQTAHIKIKQPTRKRKRPAFEKGEKKAKKIRLRVRVKTQVEPPCCLCPNNTLESELLPTDDGRKAHRTCALYGPETWVETIDGSEVVVNVGSISKARMDLKCLYCRSKRGACFQCSHRKCARSYHATCAAAAGVFVEEGEVPIFGEDGTEYKEQAFEFSCRFHRTKRDKKLDNMALDDCKKTRTAAAALKKGEIAQLQYHRGEIFAGVIVENRQDEEMFLLDILPHGYVTSGSQSEIASPRLTLTSDRVEVEWKWLLVPDPADYRLPKASPNAIPMPTSRKDKEKINATRRAIEELPRPQDDFVEGFTWAEFHTADNPTNRAQVRVDFGKDNQIWHYLGGTSTEARAQYTEDLKKTVHNPKSNFLDTIPRPPPPVVARPPAAVPHGTAAKLDRPYQYKPKNPVPPSFAHYTYMSPQRYPPQTFTTQQFAPNALAAKPSPTSTSTFAPQAPPNPPYAPLQATPNAAPPVPSTPIAAAPLTAPRLGQTPKAAAPHSAPAHSRHKSLPYGTDTRYRSSSTYGSARFSSSSSSPFSYGFMQPPGLGTSPSPQNGQVFQAQARERSHSAASAKPYTMPMTSSAIGTPSTPGRVTGGQPQVVKLPVPKPAAPSVLQKYSFFQVHHNRYVFSLRQPQLRDAYKTRDSTKYRTPYAPWGGFTNGYEGNLRAHLMKTPDALLAYKQQPSHAGGKTGSVSFPRPSSSGSSAAVTSSGHSPYSATHSVSAPAPSTPRTWSNGASFQGNPQGVAQQTPTPAGSHILQTASGPYDPNSVMTKLHPAIRAQYAAMLQRRQSQSQQEVQVPAPAQHQGLQGSPPTHAMAQGHPAYQGPHGVVPAQVHLSQAHTPSRSSQPESQGVPPMVQQVQRPAPGSRRASSSQHPHPSPAQQSVAPNLQNRPSQAQPPQATTPSHQARSTPTKQTFVPPPRPWEQLQRATPNSTMPPPASTQLPGTPSNMKGPPPLAPLGQEGQSSNVSGSLWHTPVQTMPNSSSLQQHSYDPFQFINFHQ